jgi:hypothetical protein
MPTINMDNVQLLNTVRQYAPVDYQNRIPAVTQGNIQSALRGFQDYTPSWDIFLGVFLEKIGLQIVRNTTWTNPFGIFKRAPMRLGSKIEEVAINLQRAHGYKNNCTDVFGVEPADSRVAFHSQNRHDYYKVTVPLEDVLRGAAVDEYFLSSYLGSLVDNLIVSDNADEYLIFKELLAKANERNAFFNVNVSNVLTAQDKAAASRALVERVRGMYRMAKFPSAKYSIEGRERGLITVGRDMVLIIDAATEAAVDVESLAAAFHMDKADFMADSVAVIDEWPRGLEGTQALLVDRDFFVVTDTLLSMQAAPLNPCNLSVNHYYHHWGIYSFSTFVPCIRFSTDADTVIGNTPAEVTGITITMDTNARVGYVSGDGTNASPAIFNVPGSVRLIATGAGTQGTDTGYDLSSVEWAVFSYNGSGERYALSPSDTHIDRNGILTLGPNIVGIGVASRIVVSATTTSDSVDDEDQAPIVGTFTIQVLPSN